MKKIGLLIFGLVLTASLFAAPKKTPDDLAKEIEDSIGPVEWTHKQNLSKAKKLMLDKAYSVRITEKKIPITIANPMATKDNLLQITFFPSSDVGSTFNGAIIKDLNRGDVFVTYEGQYKNRSHVWILKQKTLIESCVRQEANGGVTITNSSVGPIAMKYRGWSTGDFTSSAAKGTFQGATYWADNTNLYTLSNAKTGEYSIMILDYTAKSVSEYQLLYLGYSDQVSFIAKTYDPKKDADRPFELKEANYNNGYMYTLVSAKPGLSPYQGSAIFSIAGKDQSGVRNIFEKQCNDKILELLNQGKFFFFFMEGLPYICLTELPY